MTEWINLHTDIANSHLWKDKPFSKGQAWIDLIIRSTFNKAEENAISISEREMSDLWGWSRSKVRKFLEELENVGYIERTMIDTCDKNTNSKNHEKDHQKDQKKNQKKTTFRLVNMVVCGENETKKEPEKEPPKRPEKRPPETEENKQNTTEETDRHKEERRRIIEYLNQKCGTRYRPDTGETKGFINGRLEDGYTEDDFYVVIDKKSDEWIDTEWEKYLKPTTLFRPSNFESYINQKINKSNSTGSAYIDSIRDRVSVVDSW